MQQWSFGACGINRRSFNISNNVGNTVCKNDLLSNVETVMRARKRPLRKLQLNKRKSSISIGSTDNIFSSPRCSRGVAGLVLSFFAPNKFPISISGRSCRALPSLALASYGSGSRLTGLLL